MIVAFQILSALLVGVCYYVLAAMMTAYDGALTVIFLPFAAIIVTSAVIVLLLLAGLPIRLIRSLNSWWRRYWWVSFVLGSLAFCMMVASWLPPFRANVFDPDLQMEINSFHPTLALGGWLLTLFAVLHFYPPVAWLKASRCSR